MPDNLLTDDCLTRARDLSGCPNTNVTGSDNPAILRYLSDTLQESIMPAIMRAKQNYFVRSHLIPLVSGQSKYRFPPRAVVLKVENLVHRDTNAAGAAYSDLRLIQHEDRASISESGTVPGAFYIQGNHIVLVPEQGSSFSGFLEVPYFISSGALVLSTACRQISAVNLLTNEVTIPTLPATAALYDIVSGRAGGEVKSMDLSLASSTPTTMVFNEPIDGSTFGSFAAEVGDWVCLAETTCVLPIPRQCHSLLVQAAVVKLVEAAGDMGALQIHGSIMKSKMSDLASIIADRVESKPERLTGRGGILRR